MSKIRLTVAALIVATATGLMGGAVAGVDTTITAGGGPHMCC